MAAIVAVGAALCVSCAEEASGGVAAWGAVSVEATVTGV
jgi:hypothetical protein